MSTSYLTHELPTLLTTLSTLSLSTNLDAPIPHSQSRISILLLRISRLAPSSTSISPSPATCEEISTLLQTLLSDILHIQSQSFAYSSSLPQPIHIFAPSDDPVTASLVPSITSLTSKRCPSQAAASGQGGQPWTIYDRNSLDFILGWGAETMHQIEDLIDGSPGGLDSRRKLCRQEVGELVKQAGKRAANVLKAIEQAVTTEVKPDWDVCFGYEVKEALKKL